MGGWKIAFCENRAFSCIFMHGVSGRSESCEASIEKRGGGAAVGLICARSTGSGQAASTRSELAGGVVVEGTFWGFLGHWVLGRAGVLGWGGGRLGGGGEVVGGGG